jgi:uncharacterized membrane protein YoaK (UPF0700 family)
MALPTAPRVVFLRGCTLSFVAGYVDVTGFAALFGLFTAHVTGNFIMIGIELASPASVGMLAKLLALPAFVVAVACTRVAETALVRRKRSPVPILCLAECLFLALFMAIGLAAVPVTNPGAPFAIVAGLCAVVAMGVQNALSRTALAEMGPTTIMTGTTTQIVIDLVDLSGAAPEQAAAIKGRLRKMAPAMAGFAVGATLGALAYAALSFWSVLLPIGLLVAISVQVWRGNAAHSISP